MASGRLDESLDFASILNARRRFDAAGGIDGIGLQVAGWRRRHWPACRPPARIQGSPTSRPISPRSGSQSRVVPVPPYWSSCQASSRTASGRRPARTTCLQIVRDGLQLMIAAAKRANHLHAGQCADPIWAVRRHAVEPSPGPAAARVAASPSTGSLTNTPTFCSPTGQARTMAWAAASSTNRGLGA